MLGKAAAAIDGRIDRGAVNTEVVKSEGLTRRRRNVRDMVGREVSAVAVMHVKVRDSRCAEGYD